jgi:hypothetical protein
MSLICVNAGSVTAAILTSATQKSAQESQAKSDSQSNSHGSPGVVFDVVSGFIQTIFCGCITAPDHTLRFSLSYFHEVFSQYLPFSGLRGQMREFEPGASAILNCCSLHICSPPVR